MIRNRFHLWILLSKNPFLSEFRKHNLSREPVDHSESSGDHGDNETITDLEKSDRRPLEEEEKSAQHFRPIFSINEAVDEESKHYTLSVSNIFIKVS